MAAHSSVLAWGIPAMGEPRGLPSMESHRVRHNWNNLAAAAAYHSSINCCHFRISHLFWLMSRTSLITQITNVLFKKYDLALDKIIVYGINAFSSIVYMLLMMLFSCLVLSDSLWPHGWQHTGFPVLHYVLEFPQTHVHWVGDAIQPSRPLSLPSSPALSLSQGIENTMRRGEATFNHAQY